MAADGKQDPECIELAVRVYFEHIQGELFGAEKARRKLEQFLKGSKGPKNWMVTPLATMSVVITLAAAMTVRWVI